MDWPAKLNVDSERVYSKIAMHGNLRRRLSRLRSMNVWKRKIGGVTGAHGLIGGGVTWGGVLIRW